MPPPLRLAQVDKTQASVCLLEITAAAKELCGTSRYEHLRVGISGTQASFLKLAGVSLLLLALPGQICFPEVQLSLSLDSCTTFFSLPVAHKPVMKVSPLPFSLSLLPPEKAESIGGGGGGAGLFRDASYTCDFIIFCQ